MMINSIRKFVLSALLVIAAVCFLPGEDVEFPLVQSLARFPFSSYRVLDKGRTGVTLDVKYSNIYMFTRDEVSFNDMESVSSVLSFRFGLSARTTLELYGSWSGISGGGIDSFLEGFHNFFGLPDNARPEFPRDRVKYFYRDYFSYVSPRAFSAPLFAGIMTQWWQSRYFSVSSRVALSLPLGSRPGLISAKPSLYAGLITLYRRAGWEFGLSGHLAFYKEPNWLNGEKITPRIFMGESYIRRGWFRAGFIFRSSPFFEGALAHNAYQILLGFRIFRQVELIIQEDLAPFDTSPDICFGLRIHLTDNLH